MVPVFDDVGRVFTYNVPVRTSSVRSSGILSRLLVGKTEGEVSRDFENAGICSQGYSDGIMCEL
jgi:hypothetical protein